MDLLRDVERTIRNRRLFEADAHVLVACSGGPDSTALLYVLHALAARLRLRLSVASIDHGLRPEAAAEVAQVGEHSARLGHAFFPRAVQLGPAEAALQARARRERYRVLHELRAALRADVIAVGHTRDDQAETVLLRLLRGAGMNGLAAIAPRRHDGVVRPLIDVSRDSVVAYLNHHKIAYAHDPSNRNPRFQRIRMRSEVLPRLQSENPHIAEHLAALADEAASVRELLASRARALLTESACDDGLRLRAASLGGEPAALRRAALREWVAHRTGLHLKGPQLRELDHLTLHPNRNAQLWLDARWQVACDGTGVLRLEPRV